MTDLPIEQILAAVSFRFQAACRGRDEKGPLEGDILWMWSRDGGWSALSLPAPARPDLRVEAVKRLAKGVEASCIFLISEVTMRSCHIEPDGLPGAFLDERGERDALLGMLCTPVGDAMYLALITENRCVDVEVRGDFTDKPLPNLGSMRGLMRPVASDTTYS